MIFDVQAQNMRLHKGGAAVPCERIEAAHSHLIENMKCNFKFGCTSIAVHTSTILELSSVYGLNRHSVNAPYHDSQYWRPDTARVIQDETFVSDFLN